MDSSILPCNSHDYVYIWDQVVEGWREDKAMDRLLIFGSTAPVFKGISHH